MISPDVALALLVNRTAAAYSNDAPAYITYRERTHVSAPALGRSQEIDRYVEVRVADDYAVMQDLPRGAVRTGEAFPIIPYFDPFSSFEFSYYANLKSVDITLARGNPIVLNLPPPDPSVNVVVPYNSYWDPQYAPDSTATAVHLLVAPTPRVGDGFYPSDIVEDPTTRLPSRIVMTTVAGDETIAFDFRAIDGYWLIGHGTFTAQERVGPLTFAVVADVTYDHFAFPTTPPDPRIAPTP